MAEAKNSFIKSKMNKDLDERLIPSNEYRDALNIAVSRSEGSDVGALESILGNISVGNTASSSAGQIIGYFVDETNSLVYYFKTDNTSSKFVANSICSIEVFNQGNNTNTVLVSGSFLNFSTTKRILGVSLIEDLLFFTDNRNQPRKINIKIAFANSLFYTSEDHISVAKFAPICPPEYINLRANVINPYSAADTTLPSTMSNAADPDVVRLGVNDFSDANLSVTKYRNGQLIPEAVSLTQWTDYDTSGTGCYAYYGSYFGNEVTYGVLYNKWAVLDTRKLAPIGFEVATLAQWTASLTATGAAAAQYKSTNLWSSPPVQGTNTTGFNIKPGGQRIATSAASDFQNITTDAYFWTGDALAAGANPIIRFPNNNSVIGLTDTADEIIGASVRLVKDVNYNGWNGDPDFLKDRFARFSYRFKFNDNEYSVVAPFSQDVFIPEQKGQFVNDDENQAFITTVVEFMQNSVNNVVLNIPLPCIDIITNYKIKGIDIIFKESDKQAYQILESIDVDQAFISALNYTNVYQYNYQSILPIKTLPSSEAQRVFDKVPVRALAQETSGNRIMYANYLESYTAPRGLDYFTSVKDKTTQAFTEYPQHSLKQNRNYQVGVVLADKFGRQTDIILSTNDGLLDVNGNPQPGSNVFSDYNAVQFNSSVAAWNGDTLSVNYLQPIPESINAEGLSGYPGAYAQGSYYTVDMENGNAPNALYPYFNSQSEHYFVASAAIGVTYNTALSYAASQVAANTLNVYVNEGDGWILKTLTDDYAVTELAGDRVIITFVTAPTNGFNVKVELLFTSANLHYYRTGAASSTLRPLFPNFPTTYNLYYAVGRKLSGKYIDYTEITSVTPVSDANGVRGVDFFTKEEVAMSYLFNNTPDTFRPEPSIFGSNKTFATYYINVNGFYTYKFGVKQQQQDYYNVYLPGVINGYIIKGDTVEQGEIGFTTLISDNINKVPRNLQEVGPIQNQFTSDVTWFPRVINTIASANLPQTIQFDPSSSADSVDLIGTVKDIYPDTIAAFANPQTFSPGEVNGFTVYDYDTRPYIAKFSTRKPIGLVESLYGQPTSGTGNFPYPPNMALAVYETSPFVSQLELFYETSSCALISELNVDVQNSSTSINGSTFDENGVVFTENDPVGTTITPAFFPTSGGQLVTNSTCSILYVYSYDVNNQLDTNINYITQFSLTSVGNGSFSIKTAQGPNDPSGFYAGGATDSNYAVSTRGKFECTLQWADSTGSLTQETVTLQLVNDTPLIVPTAIPPFQLTTTETLVCTVNGSSGAVTSPGAKNGSAIQPNDPVGSYPNNTGADWSNFNTSLGFGWSVVGVKKTNTQGVDTFYGNFNGGTNLQPLVDIHTGNGTPTTPNFQTDQPSTVSSDGTRLWGFSLSTVNGVGNTPGSYEWQMRVRDDLGASADTIMSYTVGANVYTSVVATAYTTPLANTGMGSVGSSNSAAVQGATSTQTWPAASTSGNPNNAWTGQIQNWTNTPVYLYIQASHYNGNLNGVSTTRAEAFRSPGTVTTLADGTNGTVNPAANAYVTNSTSTAQTTNSQSASGSPFNVGKLAAFNPTPAMLAAGVAPGMKSPAGGVQYDFSACAIINGVAWLAKNDTNSGSASLGWSTSFFAGNPPVGSPNNIQNVVNTSPPFFPVTGGSAASSVFGTAYTAANFIGPEVT